MITLVCQKTILKCLSTCVLPEPWVPWKVARLASLQGAKGDEDGDWDKVWRFDSADVLKLYDLGIVLHRIISWFMSRCFYNNVVSSHASSSSWFRERRHHRGCSSLWGNPCCWAGWCGRAPVDREWCCLSYLLLESIALSQSMDWYCHSCFDSDQSPTFSSLGAEWLFDRRKRVQKISQTIHIPIV